MGETFDLLIVHYDDKKKVIKDVSSYGIEKDQETFYFIKNKQKSYVPMHSVIFFGRKTHYD